MSREFDGVERVLNIVLSTWVRFALVRFTYNYSGVAKDLTELTKASKPFAWSTAAELAFRNLKAAFTKAPLLVHHDPQRPSQIETDASAYAISGVLSQRQDDTHTHPIAFHSRKLTPAEMNYGTPDQELLAIVVLQAWPKYLEGSQHRITVITDHHNLSGGRKV